MNARTFFAGMIVVILLGISISEGFAEEMETAELKSKIQRWGTATLTMTDDQGKVTTETGEYPIIDQATVNSPDFQAATTEFDNCWNFCRKVCDGYGVCWVSCGLTCSPWW